ncbi:MAG: LytTR family DNA-binding domain-containing protein [Bifidobacteriaceae bacterium]|nr:LytTR family DNA-binding domain-containing protein [Bifidobacteriaceae bacterium]
MTRIGIVEDDATSRLLLRQYLDRYSKETGAELKVMEFADGLKLVERYRPDFDLLLLDIDLPGLNGFAAAERIRRVDPAVIIVFITNITQYAIRGYEVDALSYLLKPVHYGAFAREIRRSLDRLKRRTGDWLVLNVDRGLVRVLLADVVYVESVKHRMTVHTTDDDHPACSVFGALKTMEAELDGKDFFRCNSGYLVNLRHVLAVTRDSTVRLTGGRELTVSRPRKKAFLAALADYLGGGRAW